MSPESLTQFQNEIFTKIIMDELQRQKKAGTAINDYLLDKFEIDRLTAERLKWVLSQEKG